MYSRFRQPGRQAHGGTALAPRHHGRSVSDFLGLINTSRMSCVRDNERYLAFPPAVSQAFLVHSGEVRHKIVGHEKVTLENKKFNILLYLCGSSVVHLLYFMPYFVSKYIFEYLISWY